MTNMQFTALGLALLGGACVGLTQFIAQFINYDNSVAIGNGTNIFTLFNSSTQATSALYLENNLYVSTETVSGRIVLKDGGIAISTNSSYFSTLSTVTYMRSLSTVTYVVSLSTINYLDKSGGTMTGTLNLTTMTI